MLSCIRSEALMLGWFRTLMPREERFFDLFTRHARVTLAAADALRSLLKGGDNVPRPYGRRKPYVQITVAVSAKTHA